MSDLMFQPDTIYILDKNSDSFIKMHDLCSCNISAEAVDGEQEITINAVTRGKIEICVAKGSVLEEGKINQEEFEKVLFEERDEK